MSNYTKELESMFMKDSNIRKLFMEKYGFDIYNPDGTINKDRLALAMLIDKKSNGKYSLDAFLKEAIKGTGFEAGGIELNPKNLSDYYKKLLNGECEMIFAAWGGAVYWPYSVIQCYLNDSELSTQIHEGACWAPEATNLTLKLDFNEDGVVADDEEKTMTYNEWGTAINSGEFATASFDLKNEILAALESNFLGLYYCVPLYCDASVSLDSKRLNYITDEYNLMYGFGGLRFLTYEYSDQQWADYVKENGGTLNYK
jgi:oligopeptide transport system substrate-binding protein